MTAWECSSDRCPTLLNCLTSEETELAAQAPLPPLPPPLPPPPPPPPPPHFCSFYSHPPHSIAGPIHHALTCTRRWNFKYATNFTNTPLCTLNFRPASHTISCPITPFMGTHQNWIACNTHRTPPRPWSTWQVSVGVSCCVPLSSLLFQEKSWHWIATILCGTGCWVKMDPTNLDLAKPHRIVCFCTVKCAHCRPKECCCVWSVKTTTRMFSKSFVNSTTMCTGC